MDDRINFFGSAYFSFKTTKEIIAIDKSNSDEKKNNHSLDVLRDDDDSFRPGISNMKHWNQFLLIN